MNHFPPKQQIFVRILNAPSFWQTPDSGLIAIILKEGNIFVLKCFYITVQLGTVVAQRSNSIRTPPRWAKSFVFFVKYIG